MKRIELKSYINPKKYRCFISGLLIFTNVYSQAFASKTDYYRFTTDIYDQTDVLPRLSKGPDLSEEDIRNLETELLHRKEKQLDENCLAKIRTDIETLKKEFKDLKDQDLKNKIMGGLLSLKNSLISEATLAGGVATTVVNIVTGTMVEISSVVIGGIGVVALAVVKVAEKFIDHNNSLITPRDIALEMRELEKKYKELKDGLRTEPVFEIEKSYIQQKKDMDKSLQDEVERSLIQSRANDYFFQLNIPAVKYALGIALKPKTLLVENNWQESEDRLREEFKKDRSFSIYTKEIRESLLEIVLHIAKASMMKNAELSLRRVEHWFGSGSTGKSTAAKRIARFLGLPYFEKRISNENEITMANVFGSSRSIQGAPNLGWLAEALSCQTDGKAYENAFFVLDDFPVNTQNAQSILLDITDPEKKSIFNNYFQTHLNTSLLNMLIISNENFRSLKPMGEKDPTFKALTQRFDSVEFSEFTEKQKKMVVFPYLEKTFKEKSILPFFYGFQYVDSRRFKLIYDRTALNYMGIAQPTAVIVNVDNDFITPREVKRKFEKALERKSNELANNRQKYYTSYEKDQDPQRNLEHLKQAALCGHFEAINILIKKTYEQSSEDVKKRVFRWFIEKYKESHNINAAKKLCVELFKLNDWSAWADVSRYLPTSKLKDEDKLVLLELVKFANNLNTINDALDYAEEIGDYLCQAASLADNPIDKDTYLNAAKQIGNYYYEKQLDIKKQDGNKSGTANKRKAFLKRAIKYGHQPAREALARINIYQALPKKLPDSISGKVNNLSKLETTIAKLGYEGEDISNSAFDELFTTNGGSIINLWTTNSIWTNFCKWWGFSKSQDDSTLFDRLKRFTKEDDQKTVSKFHVKLVFCVGEYLLGYDTPTLQDKFKDIAGKDTIAGTNLKAFMEQIKLLFESTTLYVDESDKSSLTTLHKNLYTHYGLIEQFSVEDGTTTH